MVPEHFRSEYHHLKDQSRSRKSQNNKHTSKPSCKSQVGKDPQETSCNLLVLGVQPSTHLMHKTGEAAVLRHGLLPPTAIAALVCPT